MRATGIRFSRPGRPPRLLYMSKQHDQAVLEPVRPPSQSAASQPAASQPAASQPAASQPAASQPAASQPAASQPAPGPGRRALLAAAVTVVLWASAFVAIRSAGHYFSAGALTLGRLLPAAMVLVLISLIRRAGWPPRAAWPGIVATGVLWFGVYMVALNWGEQHVDAGTAAMVVNIGPILIALLSGWLLREGLPRPLIVGIVVSFAGVVLVGIATSTGSHPSLAGVLLSCWRRCRIRWRW
jgi:hypothetical protein